MAREQLAADIFAAKAKGIVRSRRHVKLWRTATSAYVSQGVRRTPIVVREISASLANVWLTLAKAVVRRSRIARTRYISAIPIRVPAGLTNARVAEKGSFVSHRIMS